MCYAAYLHIYYRNRTLSSRREMEEFKYKVNMRLLGIDEDSIEEALKNFTCTSDLVQANKRLHNALKGHKLDS